MDDDPPLPIDRTIRTSASPGRAWAALTDPDDVAGWLTEASRVGRVGDPYRLDFGDGSVVAGVVVELEPGRTFSHTWSWVGAEDHEETLVAWTVAPGEDGGAEIRLVHDGWSEAGLDHSTRDDHDGYWIGYLEDLAAFLADAD